MCICILFLQVARDRAVKNWHFVEEIEMEENNFGSGYPNGNEM